MFASNLTRRGFSLIELLIVATILGLLLSLVIPRIINVKTPTYRTQISNSMEKAMQAMETYHVLNNTYPATVGALSTSTGFQPDRDVTLTLSIAHTQYGYTLTGTHAKNPVGCGVMVGMSGPGGTFYNGRIGCGDAGVPTPATDGF